MMADAQSKATGSLCQFINWAGSGSVIVDNVLPCRTGGDMLVCQLNAGSEAK